MELREPSPEEMKQIAMILQQAMDPTAGMTWDQKAEMELLTLVNNSFDSDDTLHRMANLSKGKGNRTRAEVFAAGAIGALEAQEMVRFPNRISQLYSVHLVAHWFHTYERHLEQGEV
jgi:hypothetical protein